MTKEEINKLLLSEKIYDPSDPDLISFQIKLIDNIREFNKTPETIEGINKRSEILKKNFKYFGEGCFIEPPLSANFGGLNVSFGDYSYANFNLTLVDDGEITIGNNTMIGPNVTIATACHPVSPELRKKGLQYNLPVHIGKNVWIGSNAVILPGVRIGDNSIIGAGSVVTKDIESDVIAFGNPCRVYRKITEDDYKYYNHGVSIPDEFLNKK